jgi:mannose-6-phosphate isomerase-like protein (cupin superfamily)
MQCIQVISQAQTLTIPWKSKIIGQAAGANIKVLRMDASAYAAEVHAYDEAIMVLDGQMNLDIGGVISEVQGGEICFIPAGLLHSVAPGSHGNILIIGQ